MSVQFFFVFAYALHYHSTFYATCMYVADWYLVLTIEHMPVDFIMLIFLFFSLFFFRGILAAVDTFSEHLIIGVRKMFTIPLPPLHLFPVRKLYMFCLQSIERVKQLRLFNLYSLKC